MSGRPRSAVPSSTTSAIWSMNHGSMPEAAAICSTVLPACRARSIRWSRTSVPSRRAVRRSASNPARYSAPRSNPAFSIPRRALPSASLKVRPIAIVSPTDFIVDVSRGSASPNFSKANRGIFTTT